MGQTLSEPVIDKRSHYGEDEKHIFGMSDMQGWRISMEDAHAALLSLTEAGDAKDKISFFGVYDGHGGDRVAQFTGENLHKIVAQQDAFKVGDYDRALKDGFLETDQAILADPRFRDDPSGCTATVALVTGDDRLFCANAGDSRTVLGIKGTAKPLSFDHKPQDEKEKARICAAGGFVDFGRVNGNLALSRAVGDFEFKKSKDLPPEQQIVTVFPDVTEHTITQDDEFMVIACDGIWDVLSSQAVIEFVRRGIAAKQELHLICENLMDNCLATSSETGGVGCDNMTVLIVGFLQGKTKEEWYEMIAKRVEAGDGPCAPPRFAEHKGPGYHHHDTNANDYENEGSEGHHVQSDKPQGRVIILNDGTELLTDQSDPAAQKNADRHESPMPDAQE